MGSGVERGEKGKPFSPLSMMGGLYEAVSEREDPKTSFNTSIHTGEFFARGDGSVN